MENSRRRGRRTETAASQSPFQILFIAVLIAAAVLAVVCIWLLSQRTAEPGQEGEPGRQTAGLEEELAGLRSDYERQKQDLEDLQAQLQDAQNTIDLLSQYAVIPPDGEVPEYVNMFPDFYAPEWDGDTVTGGKVCCLTFDDGPSTNTDRILDTLDRYGIKATFFVVGTSTTSEVNQERMRKMVAAGHTIAMHSWSHEYGQVYASVESFLEEFSQLYERIHEVTGVYPSVFRFPGGSINSYNRGVYQEIIAEMTRRGFVYYDWNASVGDATPTVRDVSAIIEDGLKGIGKDLVVVLGHDTAVRTTTADGLPAIIEGYRAAGYTFSALHPGVTQVTFGYPQIQ